MEIETIIVLGAAAFLGSTAWMKHGGKRDVTTPKNETDIGDDKSNALLDFLRRSEELLTRLSESTLDYMKQIVQDFAQSSIIESLKVLAEDILKDKIVFDFIGAVALAFSGLPIDARLLKHAVTALFYLKGEFIEKEKSSLPELRHLRRSLVIRTSGMSTSFLDLYRVVDKIVEEIYYYLVDEKGMVELCRIY